MKFLGTVFLVLIIIVAGLYAGRDILIKNAITAGGSKVMDTNVNVDSVNFNPLAGMFHIKGLAIANPEGFSAGNAIYLGDVSVKMDVWSLIRETVKIEEIKISQPEINIVGKPGDTNLTRLQKNIASKAPAKTTAEQEVASTEHESHEEKEEHCKDVEIRYFSLDKGKVSASFSGLSKVAEVSLPTLELHNIGKDSNVNGHEAALQIFAEVIKLAQRSALSGAGVSGQLENLKSDVLKKTDEIKDKLKGLDLGF